MFQGNACLLMDMINLGKPSLYNRCLQDLVILIFKVINSILPEYLRDLHVFVLHNHVKNLRGRNKLVVPIRIPPPLVLNKVTLPYLILIVRQYYPQHYAGY